MKKKLKWIIIVVIILGIIGGKGSGEKIQRHRFQKKSSDDAKGVSGIEVQKEIKYGAIEDFSYELADKKIILNSYRGKEPIIEIRKSYKIGDKKYKTDVSDFQVESDNVETIIFDEGIKKVMDSVFNSCNVKKVFFPQSMKLVYDNTLAYFNPDDGETIKIYYAGTQDEWSKIFKEYKRKSLDEAKTAKEKGKSLADKINEMVGMKYNSNNFEYFFSATVEDLKGE